eukprot:SAG22_NODE_102_length_20195_cov_3.248308_3_plen_244_part_00
MSQTAVALRNLFGRNSPRRAVDERAAGRSQRGAAFHRCRAHSTLSMARRAATLPLLLLLLLCTLLSDGALARKSKKSKRGASFHQAAANAGGGGGRQQQQQQQGLEEWKAAADAENAPRVTLLPRDTGMEPMTTRMTKSDFSPELGTIYSATVRGTNAAPFCCMKTPRDHLPRQARERSKETLKKRPRVFSAGGSHHRPRADPGRFGLDRRAEREAARPAQPRSVLHLADLPGKKTRTAFLFV